jgi:polysaccharide export outer membrane protein
VSFQDPAGYFLATKLDMRPFDVIYVANAPQVDITKVLNFLNTTIAPVENGTQAAANIATARLVP